MNHGDTFKLILRAPGLKGRAVLASRLANLKLSAWTARAIATQCDREGVPSAEELARRDVENGK